MPDYVMDDSAIALLMPEGLFVITGCGHSGVVNTLEQAKKVTGVKKLYGVILITDTPVYSARSFWQTMWLSVSSS
ncbi:MAG: hypothetical protein A2X05_07160 [Bacteroidetes bacterium GWE2_41_25]|nr:MAG: hypothetical protein A2X03_03900 [Bacteroidetes bacterium GWA2_40_15]OFX99346.1 MAG: hypothetical protein A2X06_04680 [Bacteroidetes bacterium GWC2_40_22]OFY06788.1 MAG: hypothetical protein A2X05_07160 [Bacteroidetes bacterium GWE2_41_25]OFY59857.1 MAG: hypothetical protein A2X04_10305 [Bacteroidetes bacterium GWF2_41_9]HAM08718.1 hypothetical protein [Bacteroidales bacterium]